MFSSGISREGEKRPAAAASRFPDTSVSPAVDRFHFAPDAHRQRGGVDIDIVPADRLAHNLRRARRKLELTCVLGAPMLLVCSSVSELTIDDDSLASDQLHQLATLAQEYGVRVAYEALSWGRHVNDYEHAWRIVEAADHPALGVCLDSFHILSRATDLDGIDAIPADKLFFLQLADAPYLAMDVLQWSRHHRCFPGQGSFDLPEFLQRVVAAGYRGPLSLEVFNDVFRQADPGPTAVDAMRSCSGSRMRWAA